jgi:hypothetical protein
VSGLGFGRVVLVKVGQDDSGYRFRIAHYFPGTAEVITTESVNRNLDLALTGALVKVVPLASRVDFVSNPPGARIFIDGDKVGTTPLTTQVLPGEHVIKLELGGYKTTENTWTVPVRGALKVDQTLEKLPARIILTAFPPGTNIFVDQKLLGKDKVDQGIEPGKHVIRFAVDGYLPYETTAEIKWDDTYILTKTLEPTTWQGIKIAMHYAQEDIYSRKSSFVVAFESMALVSADVDAKQRASDANYHTTRLLSPAARSARLNGISAEYAATGRHFGLMVVGAVYSQASSKPWSFQVDKLDPSVPDPNPRPPSTINTSVDMLTVRALQPQLRLALWRFSFGIQGGLEVRGMRIQEQVTPENYKDGFLFIDLQLAAQGGFRLFVFEGLFLEGMFRRTWTVTGISGGSGPGLQGWRGGVGYAF